MLLINDITSATEAFNRILTIGGVFSTVLLAGAAWLCLCFIAQYRMLHPVPGRLNYQTKKNGRAATFAFNRRRCKFARNKESRIESFNLAAEKLTGWAAYEAIGRTVEDVCRQLRRTGPQPDINSNWRG